MNCEQIEELLPLLLDEEGLEPAQREIVLEHIQSCPLCVEEHRLLQETVAALAYLEELEPPVQLRENVRARIERLERRSLRGILASLRRLLAPRPLFKLAALTASVVVVTTSFNLFQTAKEAPSMADFSAWKPAASGPQDAGGKANEKSAEPPAPVSFGQSPMQPQKPAEPQATTTVDGFAVLRDRQSGSGPQSQSTSAPPPPAPARPQTTQARIQPTAPIVLDSKDRESQPEQPTNALPPQQPSDAAALSKAKQDPGPEYGVVDDVPVQDSALRLPSNVPDIRALPPASPLNLPEVSRGLSEQAPSQSNTSEDVLASADEDTIESAYESRIQIQQGGEQAVGGSASLQPSATETSPQAVGGNASLQPSAAEPVPQFSGGYDTAQAPAADSVPPADDAKGQEQTVASRVEPIQKESAVDALEQDNPPMVASVPMEEAEASPAGRIPPEPQTESPAEEGVSQEEVSQQTQETVPMAGALPEQQDSNVRADAEEMADLGYVSSPGGFTPTQSLPPVNAPPSPPKSGERAEANQWVRIALPDSRKPRAKKSGPADKRQGKNEQQTEQSRSNQAFDQLKDDLAELDPGGTRRDEAWVEVGFDATGNPRSLRWPASLPASVQSNLRSLAARRGLRAEPSEYLELKQPNRRVASADPP